MQVILSYSYTCSCSNCALNHLQNAIDCLCCKEVWKCVESLALLSRAKPRTWHNNRMWNNARGIQCCLPKTERHYDRVQQGIMQWTEGIVVGLVRREGENFSAFLWTLWNICVAFCTSRQIDTWNFCTVYFQYIDQCWFITAVKIITSLICAQLNYG